MPIKFRQTYAVDDKRRKAALAKLKLSQAANEPDATNDLPDEQSDGAVEAVFFGTPKSVTQQQPAKPHS